jgi:hypothetical protein
LLRVADCKPSIPAGTVEEVVRLTHKERPADGSTHRLDGGATGAFDYSSVGTGEVNEA